MITGYLTDYNVNFSELIGKEFSTIKLVKGDDPNKNDAIVFYEYNGNKYTLHHEQSCCEYVEINDIAGSLEDLQDEPILFAEVVTQKIEEEDDAQFTFYKLASNHGNATIRFYGSSNGYYSIDAQLDFTFWYSSDNRINELNKRLPRG